MATYPDGIPDLTNPTASDKQNSSTVPHATQHANANNEIEAICHELGINARGSATNVSTRISTLESSITAEQIWDRASSVIYPQTASTVNLTTGNVIIAGVTITTATITSLTGTTGQITTLSGNELNFKSLTTVSSSITNISGNNVFTTSLTGTTAQITTIITTTANITTGNINNISATNITGITAKITTITSNEINATSITGITAKITNITGNELNITSITSITAKITSITGNEIFYKSITGTTALITNITGAGLHFVSITGNNYSGLPTAISTASGIVELATIAETTTGTDIERAITPDGLSGSIYGKRIVETIVYDSATSLVTGDGVAYFFIPSDLNGMNLVDVDACVNLTSSANMVNIQIHNNNNAVDMLTTPIYIDALEKTSYTALTASAIGAGTQASVATGDEIRIDIDNIGTGTKGLSVITVFQTP